MKEFIHDRFVFWQNSASFTTHAVTPPYFLVLTAQNPSTLIGKNTEKTHLHIQDRDKDRATLNGMLFIKEAIQSSSSVSIT